MNSADSLEDSKDYEENHRLMVENVASMSAEFDYTPPKSPLEIDGERLLEVYPYLKDPANIEANILVYNYLSMMDQRAYSRASIEEMSDKFLSDIFNLGEPEELYSILKAACSEERTFFLCIYQLLIYLQSMFSSYNLYIEQHQRKLFHKFYKFR